MFTKGNGKSSSNRGGRQETSGRSVPSIISSDLSITGDLVSEGEIQIDGNVEGDIRCASLVIGVDGAVTGEIEADSIRLHGQVSGQVRARTVFLASTARMKGDVTHESLAIEPGAFIEGHCRHMVEDTETGKGDASKLDHKVGALVKPLGGDGGGATIAELRKPDAAAG